jgi:hypothetical protein
MLRKSMIGVLPAGGAGCYPAAVCNAGVITNWHEFYAPSMMSRGNSCLSHAEK